jgi:hypothetical protein
LVGDNAGVATDAGHTDGMLIESGVLKYPTFDYSVITNARTPKRVYSSCVGSGARKYIRWFRDNSIAHSRFKINIQGSAGVTFIPAAQAFSGDLTECKFEIKTPQAYGVLASDGTGWMDAYTDFSGATNDGAGARAASDGVGRALNTDWGFQIGTKSTANSAYKILVRFTFNNNFNKNLTSLTFTFL